MLIKRILYLLALLVLPAAMFAQVTTSSISGTVSDASGVPLTGATVVVTYVPSGTVFTVQSRNGGQFVINNVPPGGPYSIKATYVGYGDFSRTDINIPLGERFDIKIELTNSSQELQSVVVSAGRRASMEKTGASTSISRRQVQNLPNIGRSINGLTRITPQANGNSFVGMNNRFNNITIDGSLFNNNFGRSGDGQIPGGASAGISIDAIDQIQVNIAPYDVRQAGFTGAGINAVTKRGTNTWYGTAYTFQRGKSFTGNKVKDRTFNRDDRTTSIYGGSIGGPIIKDKLFFFINGEKEKVKSPGETWRAARPGLTPGAADQVSTVQASDLDRLKQHLISTYNFDPGNYEGYGFSTEGYRLTGRIDWNITNKHRLTARVNVSENDDDDRVNGSSGPPAPAARISNSRRSGTVNGLPFSGANFKNNTKVFSGVLELNSSLSSKVSNQLLGSYTRIQPVRIPNSMFPFVDIMKTGDPNNVLTSFGTDLFSYQNRIDDKALNIADNVTFNLGSHVITAGASFEALSFANSFAAYGGPSYYRYASLDDFINDVAPVAFGVSYSNFDRTAITPAEAKFSQLGVYLQDAWTASNKFKLTYGVRVDMPFYPYDPPRNQALEAVVFKDQDGNNEQFDVSQWPKQRPLVSPRVGFTYDIEGNKSLIVRGGSGVFTGRIPFIWLVNQVGDNGVLRSIYQPTGADLAAIRFDPDRTAHIPTTIPPVGTTIPSGSSYSATASDFKMPQVWRSNLAVDKRLGNDFTLTLEGVFSKIINNVYARNANLGPTNGVLNNFTDQRPRYTNRLNSNISQMIVLDNINKGYNFALTAMVQKSFSKGWEASLAYTYNLAQDVAIGTSDQAGSSWSTNQIINDANNPELGYSNFSIPHRITGNISYRFSYVKESLATTVSLFFASSPQERYHLRYGGDVNGDGATNDIIYIPKDATEIRFASSFTTGGTTYTAKQQSDAFFAFIENNKYLRDHKGKYMERYGATLPWIHSADLRILQDFAINAGGKKHTFQLSADVVNVLNLVNKNWGARYLYNFGSFADQGVLGLASGFNAATPTFTFNPTITKMQEINYSTSSTWGLQLGLRYIF